MYHLTFVQLVKKSCDNGRPVPISRPADRLSVSKPVLEALPRGVLVGVVQIKDITTSNHKSILSGRPVDQ